MDLSDTFKNGKMYIQEGSQWEPYFFALTHEKLIYTEFDEENRRDSDTHNDACFVNSYNVPYL